MLTFKSISVVLVLFINSLSYGQIESPPEKYSKIHYTYIKKSNFFFDSKKGIYGDTTSLKLMFPTKKFTLVNSPLDSLKKIGLISIKKINSTDDIILSRIANSDYGITEVVFDLDNLKSEYTKNKSVQEIVPDFLQKHLYKNINYILTSSIYWKDDFKYQVITKAENTLDSYKDNVVIWLENEKNVGYFEYNINNLIYTNLVFVDPTLSKYIIPTILFSNCDYGITKVESIFFTVELVKVSYK